MRRSKPSTVQERMMAHADYLDRQGQGGMAADLRSIVRGLESVTVLAEAQVSGGAHIAPEAIALAGRKFLEARPRTTQEARAGLTIDRGSPNGLQKGKEQ